MITNFDLYETLNYPVIDRCPACDELFAQVSCEASYIDSNKNLKNVWQEGKLAVKCKNKHFWVSDFEYNPKGLLEFYTLKVKELEEVVRQGNVF